VPCPDGVFAVITLTAQHGCGLISRKASVRQRLHTVSQQNTLLFLQFCIYPDAGLERGNLLLSR
jgi:hypothetical protein